MRRNLLRREVIPYLQVRINPSLRAALLRLAAVLEEDESHLDAIGAAVPLRVDGGGIRMPAPLLATVPAPVAARVVRRALREMHGGYPGSSGDVSAVLEVARGGPPVELAGGARVGRAGVWVAITRGPIEAALVESSWDLPGFVTSGPWTFEAWIEEARPVAFSLSSFIETFDADDLPASLTVRPGRATDRVAMAGGTKSIAEVLAEGQVPAARRATWPVVAAAERVIWVPGVRRAHAGWVGPSTRRYLWVRATLEGNT